MSIGAFSLSLAVKDIAVSRAFYEKIGFEILGGDQDQNWLVMRNGDTTVGLFQGMFEKNMLTFNPGWGYGAEPLDEFEDVRDIQKRYRAADIEFLTEADETTTGPASFTIVDPDIDP